MKHIKGIIAASFHIIGGYLIGSGIASIIKHESAYELFLGIIFMSLFVYYNYINTEWKNN